jgi:outer membrane autotransporter protein
MFSFTGAPIQPSGTQKIKLWRTSLGAGAGRRIGGWALDGRIAYSLHPSGTVQYSAYPDIDFDTNGTCIDGGVGLAKVITDRMSFYAGISYSLIELDDSDVEKNGSEDVSFPCSTTEILVGMLNLTCAF